VLAYDLALVDFDTLQHAGPAGTSQQPAATTTAPVVVTPVSVGATPVRSSVGGVTIPGQ
jgi:hypothetical protein